MSRAKVGYGVGAASAQVERVVELTNQLATDRAGAFEQPIGISEECLSSQKFYDLLMGGASPEDREHLSSCSTCRENLALLSKVRLEPRPDFIAQVLRAAQDDAKTGARGHETEETGLPAPAVLAPENREVRVGTESVKDFTLVVDVFPGFDAQLLQHLDLNSFKVEGALEKATSFKAKLMDFDDDKQTDSVRIRIEGAKLAPRVLKSILNHQRVIDTVRLRGRFSKGPLREFAAQANLEFHE